MKGPVKIFNPRIFSSFSIKFHAFFDTLKDIFRRRKDYIKSKLLNLEEIIPMALKYAFVEVSELGIRQNIAVWNDTSVI